MLEKRRLYDEASTGYHSLPRLDPGANLRISLALQTGLDLSFLECGFGSAHEDNGPTVDLLNR